jgi:GNAT superfamily N-acetyltransferase
MTEYEWRGEFSDDEVNRLHAEAFETPVFDDWAWRAQAERHSLGWVVARDGEAAALVGFVNVPWDGQVHAWIQDTMVASDARRSGIGRALVEHAAAGARAAGCEWLHVDSRTT